MQQLGPMCIGRGRPIFIGDKFIGLFAKKTDSMASRQKAKLCQTNPAEPYSDLGSSLRWQHDLVQIDYISEKENAVRKRARVYSHNPLETYFRRES